VLLAAVVAFLITLGLWLRLRIGEILQDWRSIRLEPEAAALKKSRSAKKQLLPGR